MREREKKGGREGGRGREGERDGDTSFPFSFFLYFLKLISCI